jgi:hypothetical protein
VIDLGNKFKGYRTRAFNIIGLALLVANYITNITDNTTALEIAGAVVFIGNLILRELTDTPAGAQAPPSVLPPPELNVPPTGVQG